MNILVGPYSRDAYGAYARCLKDLNRVWKLGPFDDPQVAQAAIRLCWGAYGSEERRRKAVGMCHVDFYDRPERYKHATPWPGVSQ